MNFRVDDDVASFVRPAVLAVHDLTIVEHDGRMDEPIAATERTLRTSCDIGEVVSTVRAMYRRFGVDPTKTRPSSEALLRRVRKGEGLPRINSLVDIGNWCSLETQLPFGLYDLGRVRGAIALRLGKNGEEYAGIRRDVIHLAGRLTLADDEGPFGNPTADSARTMVTTTTTRALMVIFVPTESTRDVAIRAAELTLDRVRQFSGGTVVFSAYE
jgi:DNA/RNA-binding domain of Phe-tRNA-synthetase-like protein